MRSDGTESPVALIESSSINSPFALKCNTSVEAYVAASLAANTQRAYLCDLDHFTSWGATIPASPEQVAAYLAAHATALAVSTLTRRLAAISKAHQAKKLPNPIRSELVKATLQGIRRVQGVAQRQAKPLLKEDLFLVLNAMGTSTKDIRDRALLLIGFAGGFRRSELVGLDWDDIEHERRGLVVHLRRSKTDQLGQGRKVAIPHGRTKHCPVLALEAWRKENTRGASIFCPVDRRGRVAIARLSTNAVSLVVRERLQQAGIELSPDLGDGLRVQAAALG